MGIGDTLWRSLANLVLRAAGDQAKVTYRDLQLCAEIEIGTEGATHVMQRKKEERGAKKQIWNRRQGRRGNEPDLGHPAQVW